MFFMAVLALLAIVCIIYCYFLNHIDLAIKMGATNALNTNNPHRNRVTLNYSRPVVHFGQTDDHHQTFAAVYNRHIQAQPLHLPSRV
jgi:hypothetical protein